MKYDYFMKEKLFEAVKKTFDLIEAMDDEELHCKIYADIEKLKFCIDKNSYNKLDKFIEEKIAPVVYEPNNDRELFERVGANPDTRQLETEEQTMQFLALVMERTHNLYKEFEEFVEINFSPILRNE